MQNYDQKRAERDRVLAEKNERMARLRAEWPNITVDYAPETWKQTYQEKHAEIFQKSVDLLMKKEKIECESEAKGMLLDILVKLTFVESNLTVNGAQTATELFKNLKLATKENQTMPFESVDDVAKFLISMSPVFIENKAIKKYCNTGVQSRRFVQMLTERLELGDVVDATTFDQIYQDFRKTIQVPCYLETFAEQEVALDFSSLHHLACCVLEFIFDKKLGRLYLKPKNSGKPERLPLYLPIFADTINSKHCFKVDMSRTHSVFVKQSRIGYPNRSEATVCSENAFNTETTCFRSNLKSSHAQLNQSFLLMNTVVSPNKDLNQMEGVSVYPYPFSLHNNFVAKEAAQCFAKEGHTDFIFEDALEQLEFWKEKGATRKNREDDNQN